MAAQPTPVALPMTLMRAAAGDRQRCRRGPGGSAARFRGGSGEGAYEEEDGRQKQFNPPSP